MKNNKDLQWIFKVSKGSRGLIGVLVLVEGLVSLIGVSSAWFLRGMIDGAVAGDRNVFLFNGIVFALIWASILGFNYLGRYLTEFTRSRLDNTLKSRLFRVLLHQDYFYVKSTHSGEWMNRLTSDCGVVADTATGILPGTVALVVRLIGALVILFIMAPKFGIILIPCGILLFICTYAFRGKLKRMHKEIQEEDGKVRVFMSEHLENLLIVKAFQKEDYVCDQGNKKLDQFRKVRLKRNRFSNLSSLGMGLAMRGTYVVCAIWCGFGILNGTISYGTFSAMLQLIGQVQSPFAGLSGVVPRYYAMLASAERLREAEHYQGYEDLSEKKVKNPQIDFKEIAFKNVAFAYEDAEGIRAIENLNLKFKKGDCVALVGTSGNGKSTFLKLLMCLYPIDEGSREITVVDRETGKEIQRNLERSDRALFAYVPQGNQLMSGSIRDAVLFGEEEDEERLKEALRIACADFVDELPNGVNSVLGEHGSGLSEGQMQRLSIARAVYSNRSILLLDEATSALDESTESAVLHNLKAMGDKTILAVTHRQKAVAISDYTVEIKGLNVKE